ncbi:MAG: hypothetical protein ACK526_20765 [Planctomyces sp.]
MGSDLDYEDQRVEPPITEWPALIESARPVPEPIRSLRATLRPRLLELARRYTDRLTSLAEAAGVMTNFAEGSFAETQRPSPAATEGVANLSDSSSLIVTGHQPVIFHSGLTFKYRMTESAAAAVGGVSLAVIMDTDDGDAGKFEFPRFAAEDQQHWPPADSSGRTFQNITSDSATLGKGSGLFFSQSLKSGSQIQTLRDQVIAGLLSTGCESAVTQATRAFDACAALSNQGVSVAEANVIVRRAAGIGTNTLEFPFSEFCQLPEVIELTRSILNQAEEFSEQYNRALDSFRLKQRIDNPANPFPNLNRRGSDFELPFWLIHRASGVRQRLQIRKQGELLEIHGDEGTVTSTDSGITNDTLKSLRELGLLIVPRGALITAFMRLLAADLFVHGIGGGRYDRFTDELIRLWWNIEPSAWTVATASRYLFRDLRKQLEDLDALESKFRDYQYNPQRYLEAGVFSAVFEGRLKVLLTEKQRLVEELKTRQSARLPATDVGRQVQQITDQIREAVTGEFSEQRLLRSKVSDDNRSAVFSRLYPWFFFDS